MSEPMAAATDGRSGDMLVVDSPYEVARWRPLVHWVMYVPHYVILYVLRAVAFVVGIIYWFILLFTGRLNPGLYGLITMYERYETRANGFLIGYTERYTPFDFHGGGPDNDAYPPVRLELPTPAESTPRTAAANFLLAIPHYVVVAVIGVGAFVVIVIGWFAVLFTGRWPQGLRDFLVRYGNYYFRVWAYVVMVHTKYPRFGLS